MEVQIEKLVHGGQGIAQLPDGRKVFVWGVLPGEEARIRIIKSKKSYAEAIAEEILVSSEHRIAPREENYLATSPWQIIPLEQENEYKKAIVLELMVHEGVVLPEFKLLSAGDEWHYRNKMEYSFWGDESGLHLALHRRGSHQKMIVEGSELALPAVDQAARSLLTSLQQTGCRAGDLKTAIVRCSQNGEAAASLFVKTEDFERIALPEGLKGLKVYYSTPKSPASVPTKLLYVLGDSMLQDDLLGKTFSYDTDSFFQVNLPIFEKALSSIKEVCTGQPIVDMYGGVGSIGLSVASNNCTIVESHHATAEMARLNATSSGLNAEVVETPGEKATEYIRQDNGVVVVDPPRAGLHKDVVDAINKVRPPKVVYLSCNPATQARDLGLLNDNYKIDFFEAYNFFPHTPHIETLAILSAR